MFGTDLGGTDSGLRVRVIWYGLLNQVLGITDYNTFAPGRGWAPTAQASMQRHAGLGLQFLARHTRRDLDERQSLGRDVHHRKVGDDAVDHADPR